MTMIDRTAYPELPSTLTERDLSQHFTPTTEQTKLAHRAAKSRLRVNSLLVMTKCHEPLHDFPTTASVPADVLEHIARALGLSVTPALHYENRVQFKCDCETVRRHLGLRGGQAAGAMQAATEVLRRRTQMESVEVVVCCRYPDQRTGAGSQKLLCKTRGDLRKAVLAVHGC